MDYLEYYCSFKQLLIKLNFSNSDGIQGLDDIEISSFEESLKVGFDISLNSYFKVFGKRIESNKIGLGSISFTKEAIEKALSS